MTQSKQTQQAHARTLEALRRIEKARGYRFGWAKHVLRGRGKVKV